MPSERVPPGHREDPTDTVLLGLDALIGFRGNGPNTEGSDLVCLVWSCRLGPSSHCVLEDAFRTGVMNKLPAGDEPFLHGHFAPRTETVGEIGETCFGGDVHGWHCP